jgi:hypothetical protein
MRLFLEMMLGCGGLALVACATGTTDEVSATFSQHGSGGNAGQGGDGQGAGPAESSTSTSGTTSSSPTAASSTSAGAGGQGGEGVGGGGGAGGSGCDYSPKETCLTATEITAINGDDEDTGPRTVKGSTSAWFKVQVKENSGWKTQLSYTATLVSPPGMLFQLFAYTGDTTMLNCLGEAEVAVGNPPSVSRIWPDDYGSEDTTWISLEVRYISGEACDPAPLWTLTVKGHTAP